jgi:hypothetical protein
MAGFDRTYQNAIKAYKKHCRCMLTNLFHREGNKEVKKTATHDHHGMTNYFINEFPTHHLPLTIHHSLFDLPPA